MIDTIQQHILELQLEAHMHGGAVRYASDSITYIRPEELYINDSFSRFADWEIKTNPYWGPSIVTMLNNPPVGLPDLPPVDFVPVSEPTQPTNAAVIAAALEALLICSAHTQVLVWRGNPTLRSRQTAP